MAVPEGVQVATGEGADLRSAIAAGAETLGLASHKVKYELDMSHFRSASSGRSMARSTVKVVVWEDPEAPDEAPKKKKAKKAAPVAEDEGAGGSEDADAPREATELKGAEEGSTEASDFAAAWFTSLLTHMGIEGTVAGSGVEDRVHLRVTADRAGRLIGKRGTTLGAIRHLLALGLEAYGSPVIDVDVDDERGSGAERRRKKGGRRDEGGDRGRGGNRRGNRNRRGRDDDRGGRGSSKYDEATLTKLAHKAANKALETGRSITINLELSSYDRRIVHMAISEVEGVSSSSKETEAGKFVQAIPDEAVLNAD